MSRIYRIKVGVQETAVHVNGETLLLPVSIANILPQENMQNLLESELLSSGWTKTSKTLEKNLDEIYKIEYSPTENNLSIVRKKEILEVAIQEEENKTKVSKRIREQQKAQQDLTAQDTKASASVLEAKKIMNQHLATVYKKALIEKAKSLGSVSSVQEHESDQGLHVRITVKG